MLVVRRRTAGHRPEYRARRIEELEAQEGHAEFMIDVAADQRGGVGAPRALVRHDRVARFSHELLARGDVDPRIREEAVEPERTLKRGHRLAAPPRAHERSGVVEPGLPLRKAFGELAQDLDVPVGRAAVLCFLPLEFQPLALGEAARRGARAVEIAVAEPPVVGVEVRVIGERGEREGEGRVDRHGPLEPVARAVGVARIPRALALGVRAKRFQRRGGHAWERRGVGVHRVGRLAERASHTGEQPVHTREDLLPARHAFVEGAQVTA